MPQFKLPLETTFNQLDSLVKKKFKVGGSSSAEDLNAFIEGLNKDLFSVYNQSSRVKTILDDIVSLQATEASTLAALISSLKASVAALGTTNTFYADMYSNRYIDTVAVTTADLNTVYGQVTLPILNTSSNVYFVNDSNNKIIHDGIEVRYAYTNNTTKPSDDSFTEIYDLNDVFSPLRPLIQTRPTVDATDRYVWVWFKQKSRLTNLITNSFELDFWPAFTSHIKAVQYKNFGVAAWNVHAFDYLPSYASTTSSNLTSVRLMFDGQADDVSDVLFCIDNGNSTVSKWGVNHFDFVANKYDTEADLFITHPGAGTINNDATVFGGILLSENISYLDGTSIRVQLKSSSSYRTPVITGVKYTTT